VRVVHGTIEHDPWHTACGRTAFGALRVAVAGLSAALLVSCSSGERFCTLGAALPSVEVDVIALPEADEVCVADGSCVAVHDGTVTFGRDGGVGVSDDTEGGEG